MVTMNDCLTHRTFYHVTLRNADGSAVRCRANGRMKTWKRDPARFRLPVKHGLKCCFYLEPSNAGDWLTYDPIEEARQKEREAKEQAREKARNAKSVGLVADVPDCILHDAMIDAGLLPQ